MQKKNPDASPYQPESVESSLQSDGSMLESTPFGLDGGRSVDNNAPDPSLPIQNQDGSVVNDRQVELLGKSLAEYAINGGGVEGRKTELLESKTKDILKERTKRAFYDNPLFKPLNSDGSVNPNWEKNREVFIESSGQGPEKKEPSLYNTPIIPGVKGTSAEDIVELGGELVTGAAHGVNTGIGKIGTGLKDVLGTLGSQTGSYSKKAEELTKGALEVATGTVEAGMGAATVVIPEFAALVGGADLIKKTAAKNLDKHEADFISTAVDVPFASVSIMADKLGFDPKEHENWAMVMELANLAAMVGGHKAITKAQAGEMAPPTPIKSLKDLQELSKEVSEGKASPEKKAELAEVTKSITEVTPAEIHEAALESGTPEAMEVVEKIESAKEVDERVRAVRKKREELGVESPTYVDDLSKNTLVTVERAESGLPVDAVALTEASDALYKKYKDLGKEKENPNRIQPVEEIDAIRDQLGKDIDILEGRKDKMRFEAEVGTMKDRLNEEVALREELAGKEGLEEVKAENARAIEELESHVQDRTRLEQERVEGEAIKMANAAELEMVLKDPEVSNVLKEKVREQLEALKSEKLKEEVIEPNQIDPEISNFSEPVKDIEPIDPLRDEKRADVKHEKDMRELETSEDADRFIAEKSESPVEIAEAYGRESDRVRKGQDEIGRLIDERGEKISLEDYTRETGNNWDNATPAERKYIDDSPTAKNDIDTRMEVLNGTVADFVEHMRSKGVKKTAPKVTELKTSLREKYRELTGQELTPSVAERVLESEAKKINKEYGKFIEQEYASYAEAEQGYYDAIKSGKLDIEGAEAPSVPGGSKKGGEGKASEKVEVKSEKEPPKEKKKEPKTEPKPKAKSEGDGKVIGITKASIKAQREKRGLPPLEKIQHMSVDELIKKADEIFSNNVELIKERVDTLYEDILSGKESVGNELDRALLARYSADLNVKIEKSATNELLTELDRVEKVAEKVGSEAGKLLNLQKMIVKNPESLSSELLLQRESRGYDDLSKAEMDKITKIWEEKEVLRKEVEAMRDEIVELQKRSEAAATIKSMGKSRVYTKRAKNLADKIRELKSKDEKVTVKDENGKEVEVEVTKQGVSTNDLIEMVAKAVESTGKVADAMVNIKAEIKDKKWYKALSKENKNAVVKQLEDIAGKVERDFDKEMFKDGVTKDNVTEVNNLASDQVRAGIKDLDTVAKNVADIIGSDKVNSNDVIDVLAGKYNEKKAKSEFVLDMGELREEARLLKEIERIIKKEDKPVSERSPRDKRKIAELKKKIRALKENTGELDLNKIQSAINRNFKEIDKIQEKMDTREFYSTKRPITARNEAFKTMYPEKMSELAESVDALYHKKLDMEQMRIEAEYANRGRGKQAKDLAKKAVRTAGVTVAGVADFSFALVHGKAAALDSPLRWAQALVKSMPEFASPKKFRERAEESKMNKEEHELNEKSGVAIVDLNEIKKDDIEMQLSETFYNNLKLPKKLGGVSAADIFVKPFQRQFISMGNILRRSMFADKTAGLIAEGKTFETHPEEFKKIALMVNTLTGRAPLDGNFSEALVNYTIWSPRKAAAAFNTIGLSDAYSLISMDTRYAKANKGYYRETMSKKDKAVRKEAIKSVVSQAMTGALIMTAARFGGAKVDDDPLSVTYGNIIFPAGGIFKNDLYWDLYGDNAAAFRAIAQAFAGEYHLKGEVRKKSAGEKVQKVIRGRVTPIVGSLVNKMVGTDYNGNRVTLAGEFEKNITPMTMAQIIKMMKYEGAEGLLLAPSIFLGDKIKSQAEFDEADKNREEQKAADLADQDLIDEKFQADSAALEVMDKYVEKFGYPDE